MTNRSHLVLIFPLISLLLFGAISFYYISNHHVWPLSRDQWHMYAPYFEHGFWKTMLSPMSTHRHIFPFFLFHLDMRLFNGLNHFLVACGALFNGLIIFLLLKSLFKENSLSFMEKICLGIFIVTELIWLLNIAQLGWGFMSAQYYLAILTFLLAIYYAHQFILHPQRRAWIGLCISYGIVSTFSFGMGILIWPCLLYFMWLWRAPIRLIGFIISVFFISLLLFFLLPGGNEIKNSLIFYPLEILRFSLQLASGPIFYLLKSWRIFDLDTCRQIATVIGINSSISGFAILTWLAWRRPSFSFFKQLCFAMMFLGLGTAVLISLTREPVFLDVWVDRYQIWATLFWTGFLPILYFLFRQHSFFLSRIFIGILACLPLLSLPSQLDMGSRLYEYKTRVHESLLSYQVGIPDKQAAIDALHWNWEHKLPFLFFVLEELKKQHKNIYYQNPADYLGAPLESLSPQWNLIPATLEHQKINPIYKNQLLDSNKYPLINTLSTTFPFGESDIVGYKFTANAPDDFVWKYAVSINNKNIINGIGIYIHHSLIPRPSKNFSKRHYNFYGVTRYDGDHATQWYFVNPQENSR